MYSFEKIFRDKITSWELKDIGENFFSLNSLESFASLLDKNLATLQNLIRYPGYNKFYVPKKGGQKRLIETPSKGLQVVLKKLNKYLQAAYYSVLPDSSYASIPSTADETFPRNVYTNALRHVKQKWLLHLDIKDFFHSISIEKVIRVFQAPPFKFNEELAMFIATLVCYQGRVPIGASSSPAIANLACLDLDRKLEKLAKKKRWKYTRYMDDLSFSSATKFHKRNVQSIKEVIEGEEFSLNHKKTGHYRIKDEPTVTGLVLKSTKPDLSKDYIVNLEKDIEIYHALTSERITFSNIFPSEVLKRFRDHLSGRLNFVRFVRGEGHKSFLRLKYKLKPKSQYLD